MSHKRKPILTVCVVLFGISSWIEINGVWVELPLLVGQLPESGYIASYITISAQLANIAPIAYGIIRRVLPGKMKEKALIHGTFVIGVTSCILLSAFWKTTSYIGNTLHSTVFLVLVFFLAFVDCTSSVLYLPFMANLKSVYLIPYLIGEGLSGLVPSCIALIQGVGGNPECVTVPVNVTDAHCMSFNKNHSFVECLNWTTVNKTFPHYHEPSFSVEVFFILLTAVLVVSWVSFLFINILPQSKKEWLSSDNNHIEERQSCKYSCDTAERSDHINQQASQTTGCFLGYYQLTKTSYYVLLVLQGYLCCLSNGILPTIQSLSCLPYGNVAFHLAVTLSIMANPLACFVALYRWTDNRRVLFVEIVVGTFSAIYIMVTAVQSPSPPLVGTGAGATIVVVSWVAFHGILAYVKACFAAILRQHGGGKSLFHYGAATQIGSFIGAVVMFVLINFTNTFTFYSPCT